MPPAKPFTAAKLTGYDGFYLSGEGSEVAKRQNRIRHYGIETIEFLEYEPPPISAYDAISMINGY